MQPRNHTRSYCCPRSGCPSASPSKYRATRGFQDNPSYTASPNAWCLARSVASFSLMFISPMTTTVSWSRPSSTPRSCLPRRAAPSCVGSKCTATTTTLTSLTTITPATPGTSEGRGSTGASHPWRTYKCTKPACVSRELPTNLYLSATSIGRARADGHSCSATTSASQRSTSRCTASRFSASVHVSGACTDLVLTPLASETFHVNRRRSVMPSGPRSACPS